MFDLSFTTINKPTNEHLIIKKQWCYGWHSFGDGI